LRKEFLQGSVPFFFGALSGDKSTPAVTSPGTPARARPLKQFAPPPQMDWFGAADKILQIQFFAFFCCLGIWHTHILPAMNTKPTPQSLLNDIAQIQRLDRGTVSVLRQGPQGPYYNHQCYENGRNVSRYVPPEQVPGLKAAIDGYRQVQELMAQYVQLLVEKTRAERVAGAKKKTQRHNSSWPKSRKSNS
jgi:hypothetical protein